MADIAPAERVRIEHTVFDFVRTRCAQARLWHGVIVTCLAATRTQLLLHRDDGRSVVLDRFVARFIQVDAVPAPDREARLSA